MDGSKLEKVYSKIKSGKATPAAVHNAGVGTNGKLPPPASLACLLIAKRTVLHRLFQALSFFIILCLQTSRPFLLSVPLEIFPMIRLKS